jgi:hypothetical protein
MARVSSDFYRSVKLLITLEEAKHFQPFHKGLDFNFYEPTDDNGNSLFNVPGYPLHKVNALDVTFTAKSVNPEPLRGRFMSDIDEELAMLAPYNRVIQDHLKHTDNKRLIHFHQPKHTLMRHATILDHPYLDGENDKMRSYATDVHDIIVPLLEIKEMEKKFEKRKAFFKRSKLDYVAKLDEQTGQKYATMKMGYIGDKD